MPSRRDQILDAAATVIAERGYQRATIRQIARGAGVSDGTIYNYFDDKAAVLGGLLDRLAAVESRRVQLGATPNDFRQVLRAFARHRFATLWPALELLRATWPEILVDPERRAVYFEAIVRPTLDMGEVLVASCVERGELQCPDPRLASRLVAGSVLGMALLRLLGDEKADDCVEQLPEAMADWLLDGMRADRTPESGAARQAGES